jgi:hypothetical protein
VPAGAQFEGRARASLELPLTIGAITTHLHRAEKGQVSVAVSERLRWAAEHIGAIRRRTGDILR